MIPRDSLDDLVENFGEISLSDLIKGMSSNSSTTWVYLPAGLSRVSRRMSHRATQISHCTDSSSHSVTSALSTKNLYQISDLMESSPKLKYYTNSKDEDYSYLLEEKPLTGPAQGIVIMSNQKKDSSTGQTRSLSP